MDAKTLRAALAAALRVTVSTSLIGCGGHTSTDGAKSTQAPATSQPDDDYSDQAEPVAGKPSSEPAYLSPVAGGASSSAGGGSMMASAAGASGSGAGGASTKPPTRCEALELCVTKLEGMTFEFGDPLPSEAAECCQTVIESLSGPGQAAAMCDDATFSSLYDRFLMPEVRNACCSEPDTWQHQACTPWGPAVPPELPLEALSAWELAA